MYADANPGRIGVCVIASEKDREKVEQCDLERKLVEEGYDVEFLYDADSRERLVSSWDRTLREHEKILLLISEKSQKEKWLSYCRAVTTEDKVTIPLIIDENLKIENLEPSVKRLVCLTVNDPEWRTKLINALKSQPQNLEHRLPIAPLHPGLVANFYYGFLDFVIPPFPECVRKWKDEHPGMPVVEKMLILIPESCKCEEKVESYDRDHIKQVKHKQVECAENPQIPREYRRYDQNVYSVTNPEKPDEVYNVVLVLCATVHTLYEMAEDSQCGVSWENMHQEKQAFKQKLTDLLKEKEQCKDKAEVVEFNDTVSPNNLAVKIVQACSGSRP